MSEPVLPNGTVAIGALGYGCSAITGGRDKKRNLRLLDTAFDSGFRHFDTAPLYGLGESENIVGQALRSRRNQVTIASKVGIARPRVSPAFRLIRDIARPVRGILPAVTRKLGGKMVGGSRGQFAPAFVEQSVNESLRRLQTDYIDVLLLHEARPEDLSDELLSLLDAMRRQGRIRALGVGSSYHTAITVAATHGDFFDVFQFSWCLLDQNRPKPAGAKFVITHQALIRACEPMRQWIATDKDVGARLSRAIGMELNMDRLGDLLLAAALNHNPGGLVLVSSRRQERIRRFAQLMSNTALREAARYLIAQIAAEPTHPQLVEDL